MKYKTTIGLEVHLQLKTKSKVFCGCSTEFGGPANTQTCPVCLGLPGALPVLNKDVFYSAVKVALALNCRIAEVTKFDRKNYFYPDLPKNYQISQYDLPLSEGGFVEIDINGTSKKIRIKRVHQEEDTGKLIHQEDKGESLVDFNRSGVPLLELVTEPDINSPEEAYEYLTTLKSILQYLDVSDCDMEKGSLRCDANISLAPEGSGKLGTKTEIKNMNSFKAVKAALSYEAQRQSAILESGGKIIQETRLWSEDRAATASMRTKEEAHDYRYFPEPDLVPYVIDKNEIERKKKELPELPAQKKERLIKEYGLSGYDAGQMVSDKHMADYFQECVKLCGRPKDVINWLISDIMAQMNERKTGIRGLNLPAARLAEMIRLKEDGTISGKIAKQVLRQMIDTGGSAAEIIKKKGLKQISGEGEIAAIVDDVIRENPKPAQDYKSGKQQALAFLVGQVMRKSRGRANPGVVNSLLKEKLKNS